MEPRVAEQPLPEMLARLDVSEIRVESAPRIMITPENASIEKLFAMMQEMKQENARKDQENARKDQENERKDQENERKDQENERKHQENERKDQENERKHQETKREMKEREERIVKKHNTEVATLQDKAKRDSGAALIGAVIGGVVGAFAGNKCKISAEIGAGVGALLLGAGARLLSEGVENKNTSGLVVFNSNNNSLGNDIKTLNLDRSPI